MGFEAGCGESGGGEWNAPGVWEAFTTAYTLWISRYARCEDGYVLFDSSFAYTCICDGEWKPQPVVGGWERDRLAAPVDT